MVHILLCLCIDYCMTARDEMSWLLIIIFLCLESPKWQKHVSLIPFAVVSLMIIPGRVSHTITFTEAGCVNIWPKIFIYCTSLNKRARQNTNPYPCLISIKLAGSTPEYVEVTSSGKILIEIGSLVPDIWPGKVQSRRRIIQAGTYIWRNTI